MPCSVQLEILPVMISPLKGRKTMRRNSTVLSVREQHKYFMSANTIDVDEAITVAYETIRNFEKIVHADA